MLPTTTQNTPLVVLITAAATCFVYFGGGLLVSGDAWLAQHYTGTVAQGHLLPMGQEGLLRPVGGGTGGAVSQDSATQSLPAAMPAGPAAPLMELRTVMFAMIARNAEHKLPYLLHNIERLGRKFKRVYVVMVENDSTDRTREVFGAWLESRRGPDWDGELIALQLAAQEGRNLTLMAQLRNVYIDVLAKSPKYADVDYLVAVDSDMCQPWNVESMQRVFDRLLPSSGVDWDVLFAYGSCGWFQSPDSNEHELKPGTEDAVARYCDLFALQDAKGLRYVTRSGGTYSSRVSRGWRLPVAAANATHVCTAKDAQGEPCRLLHGEPVMPVQAAFGGFAVYCAELFRGAPAGGAASSTAACRYWSDGDECEHVGLGSCLHKHGARQLIALQLVVDWEGCGGPVRDTIPDQGPWAGMCVCGNL